MRAQRGQHCHPSVGPPARWRHVAVRRAHGPSATPGRGTWCTWTATRQPPGAPPCVRRPARRCARCCTCWTGGVALGSASTGTPHPVQGSTAARRETAATLLALYQAGSHTGTYISCGLRQPGHPVHGWCSTCESVLTEISAHNTGTPCYRRAGTRLGCDAAVCQGQGCGLAPRQARSNAQCPKRGNLQERSNGIEWEHTVVAARPGWRGADTDRVRWAVHDNPHGGSPGPGERSRHTGACGRQRADARTVRSGAGGHRSVLAAAL